MEIVEQYRKSPIGATSRHHGWLVTDCDHRPIMVTIESIGAANTPCISLSDDDYPRTGHYLRVAGATREDIPDLVRRFRSGECGNVGLPNLPTRTSVRAIDVGYDLRAANVAVHLPPDADRVVIEHDGGEITGTRSQAVKELSRLGYRVTEA